jgi:hypothetical protein
MPDTAKSLKRGKSLAILDQPSIGLLLAKSVVVAGVARGAVEPVEIGVGKDTKPERLRFGSILRIDIFQQPVDWAELRYGSRGRQANQSRDD